MQRRELLSGSAIAGASALGGGLVGCAGGAGLLAAAGAPTPGSLLPGLPAPVDMRAFCLDLEAKLGGISQSRFVEGFATRLGKRQPTRPAQGARMQEHEALFQRSLRSLFLSQTFRDLPVESQQHPELQALMQRHLPEIDQTVFDVTELLENLGPAERQATREELRRHPNLPLAISEAIDERAAEAGVSSNRRRQLRSMLTQTSFRLRHASPDVLIDEYTAKVRRATAPDGAARALSLSAASQATADVFFGAQVGSGSHPIVPPGHPKSTTKGQIARQPAPGAAPTPATPANAPPRHPGMGAITTGAWLLGIGAVTFGVSAGIVSAGADIFLIGMTVGAVLFAIGLVVLIVGGIIYAAT